MSENTNIKDKVIVITGASSGLGRATATLLASQGGKIVIGARRSERLKEIAEEIETAGGKVTWKETDVTSLQSVQELVAHGRETFGPIDVLINNAGINTLGKIKDLQVDSWERMIDVNIKGPLNGIAAVIEEMQARGSGHIITTSSSVAHQGMSNMVVYNGTKAAIKMIHEGLRQEIGGKVRVTTVSPGGAYTEIGTDDNQEAVDELMKEFEGLTLLDPGDVARAFAYAISQPDNVDINDVLIRPSGQPM